MPEALRIALDAFNRIPNHRIDTDEHYDTYSVASMIEKVLAKEKASFEGWTVEDVRSIDPDLTEEQASIVLSWVAKRFDATRGVNWDVIEEEILEYRRHLRDIEKERMNPETQKKETTT
jgi:predicted transcriptional regulator